MDTYNSLGPSPFDDDPCVDEILAMCEPYIRSLAIRYVPRNVYRKDADDAADDLAENTLIKLWQALLYRTITNPRAYVRMILLHEVVNMVRSNHHDLPLELNEDGELMHESLLQTLRGEMSNPEVVLLEQETEEELLSKVVEAIREWSSSPRQQQAVVCRLNERVDDVLQFKNALKHRDVDCDAVFPEDKKARQTLQSSYSPARGKLAIKLDIDLDLYK